MSLVKGHCRTCHTNMATSDDGIHFQCNNPECLAEFHICPECGEQKSIVPNNDGFRCNQCGHQFGM